MNYVTDLLIPGSPGPGSSGPRIPLNVNVRHFFESLEANNFNSSSMRDVHHFQRLRVAVAGAAGVDQTAVPDLEPGPEIRRQNAQTPAGGVFLDGSSREGGIDIVSGKLWRKPGYVLFFLWAVTLSVFFPMLAGQFTALDDPGHLLENPQVISLAPENITAIFRTTVNDTYIPLTILSFAVEHHFFGFHPFVYHWDNLLLHMFVVGVLFGLGRRMGLSAPAAGVGSLLFAVHPMHVESVAWVTERKDVLYAFFYMLALSQYCRYLQAVRPPAACRLLPLGQRFPAGKGPMAAGGGNRSAFAFSVVFGFLSILAKPMALSLPFVLCLFDLFYGRKFSGRWLAEKLVHAAYIIPVAWITASLHQRRLMDNWAEAVLTAVWSFVFYIRKFIYPVDLSPLYATPSPVSLENPEILFSVILFAVYVACLVRYRRNRWFFFANGFFVASIFFLVRLRTSWGLHEVADRFMYLPSLGFCLLFGLGVEWLFLRARANKRATAALALGLALVFTVLSVQSCRQTKVWENDATLWASVIQKGATDRLAYFARGKMYDEKGDHVNAVADYTMAIALDPKFPRAYNNRGIIYGKHGDYDRALADFNRALALYPEFAQAHNNRGLIYFYLREDRLALEDFNKTIELRPRVASSYVNRARLFQVTGQYRLAAEDFTRALQLDPGNAAIEEERAETYRALEGRKIS